MAACGQGTMSVSYEGNCPLLLSPTGLLLLGLAFLPGHPPEGWLQMFCHLSHLVLYMKSVAVN